MKTYEHGGQIHHWRKKCPDMLDYSANINPLGLSLRAVEAIKAHVDQVIHYPEPRSRELQQRLSEHYQVSQDQIFVSNGAAESLYLLGALFRPQKALLTAPTFSEYEKSLLPVNTSIEHMPLNPENGFSLSLSEYLERIDQVDIAYLGNPNNPVGPLLTLPDWILLLEKAKEKNTVLVVDESFLDFLPDFGKEYSVLTLISRYPRHLIVVRSLTKFYSLPGLRLGFTCASSEVVKKLEDRADCWNVNYLAQKAGIASLEDRDYQTTTQENLPSWQRDMMKQLESCDFLETFQPVVNFVLCRIKDPNVSATQLTQEATHQGLLIRDCSNFKNLDSQWIRMAIRESTENHKAIARLKEAWRQLSQ